MATATLDEVRQALADVLGLELAKVPPDASPETLPEWDSMAHLNLVLALEQGTGVALSPEEMGLEVSVQRIAHLIDSKRS